jgi:diadenosine tetraphosphate (Ap4A) HIT family hydrolase
MTSCVACLGQWPAADHRVAELETTVVYFNEDQFFPGWTFLILKRHATELFELTREERSQLIEEVNMVARALATVLGARKMNYELLGNQVAHIHWHLVPRLANDPAPREPAWRVPHDPKRLPGDELRNLIHQIRSRLNSP